MGNGPAGAIGGGVADIEGADETGAANIVGWEAATAVGIAGDCVAVPAPALSPAKKLPDEGDVPADSVPVGVENSGCWVTGTAAPWPNACPNVDTGSPVRML